MSGRFFIGPPNAEIIGKTSDGAPIVANEDGAGAMHDITRFVDVEPWPLMGIRKEETDDR